MSDAKEKTSEVLRNEINELRIVAAQLTETTSRLVQMLSLMDEFVQKALEVSQQYTKLREEIEATKATNKIAR
jgi:hypothetical protein